MSSLFYSPSAIEAIRRLLDSAAGQTPLGRMLESPVRVLECTQTARDIEVDSLTQHTDRLNREKQELYEEYEKLQGQLWQERMDARARHVEMSTDLNRTQSENRLLRKQIKELTGKEYVGRTPKP